MLSAACPAQLCRVSVGCPILTIVPGVFALTRAYGMMAEVSPPTDGHMMKEVVLGW